MQLLDSSSEVINMRGLLEGMDLGSDNDDSEELNFSG